MPELGKKYTCYSCHTKFYDLGKPIPVCPKCGADQRDSEETATVTPARSRSRVPVVVEEPVEEPDFEAETPVVADEEEEDVIEPVEPEREEEVEEEEEEF